MAEEQLETTDETIETSDTSETTDETDVEQNGNTETPEQEEKQEEKQEVSDIYGSPETFDYSSVKLPEGMTLDEELTQEFEPIAKKLNLSQTSANELMALAVKLTEKNAGKFSELAQAAQEAKKNSYLQLLNTDKELNAGNATEYNNYLNVANEGLKAVATPKFIELLKAEGLTHHPEFIKTFHKIGELCASEKIPDVTYPVGQKELDPADVLYGERK